MSLVENAAEMIADRGQTIVLVRTTRAAPDEATPWQPGEATLDVYEIDGFVKGVSAEYIDGTTVLATDRMVVARPQATHTMTGGEPADDGAVVDLEPLMTDGLQIDGRDAVVKKVSAKKDGDAVAMYLIFVGS